MSAACYLVSYSVLPPNTKSAWFARATGDDRKVYTEWIKCAKFRASQTGMSSFVPLISVLMCNNTTLITNINIFFSCF